MIRNGERFYATLKGSFTGRLMNIDGALNEVLDNDEIMQYVLDKLPTLKHRNDVKIFID